MKNQNTRKVKYSIESGSMMFLLFLTFLILKLCNVITWSWWWVTAPLWAPFALSLCGCFGVIAFLLIFGSAALLCFGVWILVMWIFEKRKRK